MLGAGVVRIAADALRYFKGKYIRLFPHLDAAGWEPVRLWAQHIKDADAAKIDAFDFSGQLRDDGTPGKDLADICRIEGGGNPCKTAYEIASSLSSSSFQTGAGALSSMATLSAGSIHASRSRRIMAGCRGKPAEGGSDAVSCYCFNGDLNVRAIFWPYVPPLLSSRQLASRRQLR